MNRKHIESTAVGIIKFHHLTYSLFDSKKKRMIRVYLPSDYYTNENEKYDVLYMLDGQNLFDAKTAAYYKEWQIDKTIESLKDEIKPTIVVGLDCSEDRMNEYLPDWDDELLIEELTPKSDLTFDFLINRVMPFIEKHYRVNLGREHTSFGGSSMGGLMALEALLKHNDLFKNYYAFSPAFSIFRYGYREMPGKYDRGDKVLDNILVKLKQVELNYKLILTSGGQGYEESYYYVVKKMKKVLAKRLKDNLLVKQDMSLNHDENQWAIFFKDAYKFVNNF